MRLILRVPARRECVDQSHAMMRLTLCVPARREYVEQSNMTEERLEADLVKQASEKEELTAQV